ncbi:type VI secretion system baseplate subunit TssE [Janthinobacterium aquaticum]|uniref:type VI secretion system baseplate subunit TssE n=1 Tax=Janthinobacterium sp. FT58W TaxID=2654254 RepID=UPI001265811B|nr:type VI secretion system baseplate subunit TssE [Janthinobacterium sp. FT58W]KAB8044235.1 type VI secretion system baseplate subunit TssE [Janthinobacterium sp. FT58W]
MSKAITASLVPLFDRLAGTLSASPDGRLLDGGGLQQSLQLDLLRLFNVRNALSIEQYLALDPALLPFGLPDMMVLSARSEQDLALWASVMQRCLARFETRLSHVSVRLQGDPERPHAAQAEISAVVALGAQLCRVNFNVAVDARSAALQPQAA